MATVRSKITRRRAPTHGRVARGAVKQAPRPSGLRVTRAQVLAFRFAQHHLDRPPRLSLEDAVAACGVQDTPPGSAVLALAARVPGLQAEDVADALGREKSLLETWSLRGATYLVPTRDAALFTLGLLPRDEASLRFFLGGVMPTLDARGVSATEAVERTAKAMEKSLDGRMLTKVELHAELRARLPGLLIWCERCQSHHVHPAQLHAAGMRARLCFAPRQGREAMVARSDQWLPSPPPTPEPHEAAAGLVRRYLHCYGPSRPEHFAAWAGIAPAQARDAWKRMEAELMPVSIEGRDAWSLRTDAEQLASPPTPRGTLLLPPSDPYLAQRDRELLVPDKSAHRRIWRPAGMPGALVIDGELAATWRSRKRAHHLEVEVEPLRPLAPKVRRDLEAEALKLAAPGGPATVSVTFAHG